MGKGSCDHCNGDDQKDTQRQVAPPFGPAAVRVDVDVRHSYFTCPVADKGTATALRRLLRSIQYTPAKGISRLPSRPDKARTKSMKAKIATSGGGSIFDTSRAAVPGRDKVAGSGIPHFLDRSPAYLAVKGAVQLDTPVNGFSQNIQLIRFARPIP
jgi:hypothetical protein